MEHYYCEVAQILQKVSQKLGGVNTFVYQSKLKNKKLLLKLCCESIRHEAYLKILLNTSTGKKLLKSNVIRQDYYLATVLLYELIIGKKFLKLNTFAKCYRDVIRSVSKSIKKEIELLKVKGITLENLLANNEIQKMPRYVRINTLKISFDDAIKQLEADGFIVESLQKNITNEQYRELIFKMTTKKIYIDPHIENLLIFAPQSDLHKFWMTKEFFVLQDKASCLPAIVLNIEIKTSHLIDACAAPGMKTSHLAAIMNNEGKIFAFDQNKDRLKTMQQMLNEKEVKNTVTICSDFLKVNVLDKKFQNVNYALIDPPCSGSGIMKRGVFNEKIDEKRLYSLANLQAMLLKHALRLPNLIRCVYSTCSISEIENENVIQEVLLDKELSKNYELVQNLLPNWLHRGLDKYKFGQNCLRANFEEDLTNGFFVAVFQRKNNFY